MAEETQLDFRIQVGGLNHLGRLNSKVLQLRKGVLQLKPASMGLTAAFQKQKGAAGQITKIFYGQAQSIKQLVRNQKIYRREINSQVNALKKARKAVKGNADSFKRLTQELRKAKRQMRSLPLRKLGTDLTNLSKKAVNAGKNMQWVGRQMMVGITAPMGMLLRMGMRAMESFEKQAMRTRKILALTEDEMKDVRETMKTTARVMGVARSVVAGLTSDFAQMGKKLLGGREQLTVMAGQYAQLALELELVGQVSSNVGRDFIGNLAGIIKSTDNMYTRIDQVKGLLAKFNMLENTTALSLKDLAEAFPQVSPAAKAAGVDLVFLAGVIANMKEVGLNATESAHALKFGLQRMINPTAKVARLSEQYANTWSDFNEDLGMGNEMLFNMAENFKLISTNAGDQAALVWLGELVGKRQASRLYAATMNMGSVAQSIEEIGEQLMIVTKMPALNVGMVGDPTLGADASSNIKASELIDAESFTDVKRIIGEMFGSPEAAESFKDSVIASDMALGDMSEGLHEGSRMAAVMAVALKGLDPALRSLVIDYMGATEAGKVFAEELSMVLAGPAARMQKLKNDMKEMLLEFGSAFFDVIKPVIESLRKFIHKIADMDPHMKQAIVMMMAFVGIVGPATFTFAMFTLAIGVMGGYVVKLLPKMKHLSSSFLLSKSLAGEATPAMMSFGGGLAQVGTVSSTAQKSLLKFGGTAVTMTEALRAESTIGMSQYGAYLGTIAASTNALGAGLVGSAAGFAQSAQIIVSGGIAATTAGVTQAQGLMLSQAATAIQASALQVGGTTAQAASGLTALVIEYDTTLAALATATASGTSATAAQALTAFTTAAGLMEAEVAAVAASMGTTIAAGTAATAAATTVNEAAAVKTITGIRAMYAAQVQGFATMHKGMMGKMGMLMKRMLRFILLGQKHSKTAHMGALPKGVQGPTHAMGPKVIASQWKNNMIGAAEAIKKKFVSVFMKMDKHGNLVARRGAKHWIKAGGVASKVWTGQMTKATVKINVKNKLTAMKSAAYWKTAAKSSAKSIAKNIGGALKLMAFQSFVTASFMKAAFTRSAKAIKLAMIGTGIGALLIIVGAAIVFVIAKFDKFKAAGQGALLPLKKAWNNLKMIFMEVGTVIFETFEELFGAGDQAEGMVEGFSGVQKLLEGIGKAAEFMSRVFMTVMRKVMVPVIKGLLTVVKFVVEGVGNALEYLREHWTKIAEVISTVIKVILKVVEVYVTMQLAAFRVLANGVRILGAVFFGLLNHVIVPVFTWIETVITTVVDVIFKAIEWIVTQLLRFVGVISPVLSKLMGFLEGVVDVFNKVFGTDFSTNFAMTSEDIDKMSADLQQATKDGGDMFDVGRNRIHDFVHGTLPGLVRGAGDIFDGVISKIDEGAGNVLSGVGEAIDSIEDKLTGAITGGGTQGAIAESFKLGINDGLEGLPEIGSQDTLSATIRHAVMIATLEGIQAGINEFIGKVKSMLQAEIAAAADLRMAGFDAHAEVFLSAYETRIDAINDTIKLEKNLTATLKYETDRRAQINKMALDKENFIRNRALAIYEGRVEDARGLSVKFSMDSTKSTDKLSKLDTGRENKLLDQSRKDAIEEINLAKSNKAELIKIQRDSIEEQLAELKKRLPQTDAEYAILMADMNTTIKTGMNEAFGADSAAAGSIAEFRTIVDNNLKGQFSGLFSDVGVDDLGITSVTATISTAVDGWGTLIDNQDFTGKFQTIFDSVNEIWKKELEWEKFAHEEFSIKFDTDIAMIQAHIKYLKGELDEMIAEMDHNDAITSAQAGGWNTFRQSNLQGQGDENTPTHLLGGTFNHTAPVSAVAGRAANLANLSNMNGVNVLTTLVPALSTLVENLGEVDREWGWTADPFRSLSDSEQDREEGWTATDTSRGAYGRYTGGKPDELTGAFDLVEGSRDIGSHVGSAVASAANAVWDAHWLANPIDNARSLGSGVSSAVSSASGIPGGIYDFINWLQRPTSETTVGKMLGFEPEDPAERGFKHGGLVSGELNSIQNIKAHAGEYVMKAKAVQTTGLARLNDINAGRGEYEGDGGGGTTIYVENFIGQPGWFEEMMKEYNVHVKPANERAAGTQSRRISSMSGIGA